MHFKYKRIMKYLYIILTEFIIIALSGKKNYSFFPNLPAGEFKIYIKGIVKCVPIKEYDRQLNFYLSKTSHNSSELMGNITLIKSFDNSLSFNVNMAVRDSIGGWKDNAFIYSSPEACSTMELFFQSEWVHFVNSFGRNDSNCPISPGVYVTKGYDATRIQSKMRFPKVFFYGTYKFRLFFADKNKEERGCVTAIIDIKRPWESE